VHRHIEKRRIGKLRYEVSGKHSEGNLHINCAAVTLSTIVIVAPHFGQTQDETTGAISVD
jgi:hypothetical protein